MPVRRPTATARVLPRSVAALLLFALAALVGCSDRPRAAPEPLVAGQEIVDAAKSMQPESIVDLKVYLRSGTGPEGHLVAVTREAPIAADLPRRALELLVAGPAPEDPEGVRPVLPPATRVLGLSVRNGVAAVDLSAELITDKAPLSVVPEHELLALGAIANTLTEFPEIEAVRLTVGGHTTGAHGGVDVGRFWGAWGLPPLLRRDEGLIGPPREGDSVPRLDVFKLDEQRVGSADAAPASVRHVRALDRLGYLRLVVELGDGQGGPAKAVPPTLARIEGGRLVLQLAQVVSYAAEVSPGQRVRLSDEVFEAVEVDATELPGVVRLGVVPGANPFHLHTLTSPTRVVLDVRK